MEALDEVNSTRDKPRLPLPLDDGLNNPGYHDYEPGSAMATVLPTVLFEGMNFPEDTIRLLSVQVQLFHISLLIQLCKLTLLYFWVYCDLDE